MMTDDLRWQDDMLRRMADPNHDLKRQLECLEREKEERIRKVFAEREAERLRQEIRKLGELPCR